MLRHTSSWTPVGGTLSHQSCGSFTSCRFGKASNSSWQSGCLKVLNGLVPPYLSDKACQRHQPPTVTVFRRPNNVCYNVPLHAWEIGLLLMQDNDRGTVSQQNCDNRPLPGTIPSGAKDAFVLLMAAASRDCYSCRVKMFLLTYLFTYLRNLFIINIVHLVHNCLKKLSKTVKSLEKARSQQYKQ